MAIEIGFRELYVPLVGDGTADPVRAELTQLAGDQSCVHGTVWIRVNGCDLPALGYWGPDDVCVGAWVAELSGAVRALKASDRGCYVYDEGEQGQPAFVFTRLGSSLRVSMERSALGDGQPPPSWPEQECEFSDFVSQVQVFLDGLRTHISAANPVCDSWLETHLRAGVGTLRA